MHLIFKPSSRYHIQRSHHGSTLWDHLCCLRHHRVCTGQASGIVLGTPAYPGISFSFSSQSTRMKNDPYLSWKAPCSFRVTTDYIREFCTRSMPILIPGSRWLHGRNMVAFQEWYGSFSSVYSRTENCAGLIFLSQIFRCAKDHDGCLPGVYTVMPEISRMIPE